MSISPTQAQLIANSIASSDDSSLRTVLETYVLDRQQISRPLDGTADGLHRFFYRTTDPGVFLVIHVNDDGIAEPKELVADINVCLLVAGPRHQEVKDLMEPLGFGACSDEVTWNLDGRLTYPGTVSEHIDELLERLGTGMEALAKFIKAGKMKAWLCVTTQPPSAGIRSNSWVIPASTLSRVCELGAKLNVQFSPVSRER